MVGYAHDETIVMDCASLVTQDLETILDYPYCEL